MGRQIFERIKNSGRSRKITQKLFESSDCRRHYLAEILQRLGHEVIPLQKLVARQRTVKTSISRAAKKHVRSSTSSLLPEEKLRKSPVTYQLKRAARSIVWSRLWKLPTRTYWTSIEIWHRETSVLRNAPTLPEVNAGVPDGSVQGETILWISPFATEQQALWQYVHHHFPENKEKEANIQLGTIYINSKYICTQLRDQARGGFLDKAFVAGG